MKLFLIYLTFIGPWSCYANSTVKDDPLNIDPLKSQTILGNPKGKPQNGRSLVAVNEQSQEKSSSRFFGPSGYGMYPGYGGPAQFPGAFGGYPGMYGGYPGGYGGYPGGYPGGHPGGYPGGPPGFHGGYPGGYGYPGAGAFAGHTGFGYGLQQQQQQQLQGGGYSSGAFVG